MASAVAEEVVEDLHGIKFGATLDAKERTEFVSCSWEACLFYRQRGSRMLLASSLRMEGTLLSWCLSGILGSLERLGE